MIFKKLIIFIFLILINSHGYFFFKEKTIQNYTDPVISTCTLIQNGLCDFENKYKVKYENKIKNIQERKENIKFFQKLFFGGITIGGSIIIYTFFKKKDMRFNISSFNHWASFLPVFVLSSISVLKFNNDLKKLIKKIIII